MKQRGRKSSAALAVVAPETAQECYSSNICSPEPPAHLSTDAAASWQSVVRDYDLEPHHLRLLQAACEAWDRCQQAREAVLKDGLTFRDSNTNLKANPAVAIERDARTLFARLVRELDLDAEGPAERIRPPSLLSNRRGNA